MKKLKKFPSLVLILMLYLICFFILRFIFPYLPSGNIFLKILLADGAGTVVIFLFSLMLNNSSVYHPYWSVAPPVIAGYLAAEHPEGNSLRQVLVLILILFWSIRLTANWATGWKGIQHQDWRYKETQEQTGKFYWPVSFLGIHMMPTLLVYLGCLPLFYILPDPSPIGVPEWIAGIITFCAVIIEWTADKQLWNFRKNHSPEAVMKSGLWKFIRHPNYFGEICFWSGIYIFILAGSTSGSYWTGIGFLSIVMLFSLISVPIMDKHNMERRPGYAEQRKKTRALFPLKKL